MGIVLLIKLIELAYHVITILLIVRVILSWIPHVSHPVIDLVYQITEPLLKPFRNIVPDYRFGLDLSPVFAFIVLGIIRYLLLSLLG